LILETDPDTNCLTTPDTAARDNDIALPISNYKTFKERMRHKVGGDSQYNEIGAILEQDPTVQAYHNHIRTHRDNNGYLSHETRRMVRNAIRKFALFTDLPIAADSYSKLIQFKISHPQDKQIEQKLQLFVASQPEHIKRYSVLANYILGLFNANFAPLQVKISAHFPPAEENCSEGIFLEIYKRLDQETKDMIQWGQYVPERAKAAYRVSFDDIDLSRSDYAVVWIQATRSKTRAKHPCFVPIEFAKRIISNSKASGRKSPFPNHESLWKKVSQFAREEYKVRLVSNYLRKRYVDIAEQTTMPKSQAAFIMDDKIKIAKDGIHMDLVYGRGLRFVVELITNYKNASLAPKLTITNAPSSSPSTLASQEQTTNTPQLFSLLTDLEGS
jgi:hypothetical protein